MQHPIGQHALLADCRTAALIDPDGNVAWLCWPWVDSTPLFFSILDGERGGVFALRPSLSAARIASRRYHPRSLVLETVWEMGDARLIVEEALDLGDHPVLVRTLRADGGAVEVSIAVEAPMWDSTRASLHTSGETLAIDGISRLAVRAPSHWTAHGAGAICRFVVIPGATEAVTLCDSDADAHAAGIDSTLTEWHRMLATHDVRGLHMASDESTVRELLGLSAAVLVGLRRHAGGIVAAPTTSLPQWPGSGRTWDYRYCWLRDSSLAALAMLRLGLVAAARELAAFIGNVVNDRGPAPIVRLDGSAPPTETERPELAGYRGARPVRIGNGAAAQAQLDVPGEVIELATALARAAALPDELRIAVPVLAGWLVEHWREPDYGIWEIRGPARRYTHSLVTALSGLRGASALADDGMIAGDAASWRTTASAIVAELSATKGPLQIHLDGGGADAALAQLALLGGLESLDERVDRTLGLIVARLGREGLVNRHEPSADPVTEPCAPFLFATFWLAAALAARGRDGSAWLRAALATRGPLGLFGEVASTEDHAPFGNYPQVQSHASFVLAVTAPSSAT